MKMSSKKCMIQKVNVHLKNKSVTLKHRVGG